MGFHPSRLNTSMEAAQLVAQLTLDGVRALMR